MRKTNLVTSIVLLALSFAALVETSKLSIGNIMSPEPGFFPLILSILLGILSLILLIQTIKGKGEEKMARWVSAGGLKRLALTVGALFVFGIFFERLGYLLSTFLLIAFLVGVVGTKRWWVAIMTAFLSSLISYLIFGVLLKSELPAGILKSVLPQ